MKRPQGMFAFSLVWFGQLISLVGTTMSGFALTIWAWQTTGSATALALVGFCEFVPGLLFSPISGALVDRWNRKLVMMISDLAAGLSTIIILVLFMTDSLEMWQLYILGAFTGIFQSFQWPAYSAAISTMLPKEQYARAAGMMSLAEWGSGVFSPVLAGLLLVVIGLQGILMIDIATFTVAIGMLLLVIIPNPTISQEGTESQHGLASESLFGFKYIFSRPSLLQLQLIFTAGNFLAVMGAVLTNPMVLSRTGDNASILGFVLSAGAVGGIAGSLLITVWGGPRKKINGVLWGWLISGLFGQMVLGLGSNMVLWIIGSFFGSFAGPLINSSNQAIWQSKVPPDIQGKVFSVRRMIAQIAGPVGGFIAAPLADWVVEPAMQSQTLLSSLFGPVFGTVAGSGMSLIIAISGFLMLIVFISGKLNPLVRDVESLIADHDQIM